MFVIDPMMQIRGAILLSFHNHTWILFACFIFTSGEYIWNLIRLIFISNQLPYFVKYFIISTVIFMIRKGLEQGYSIIYYSCILKNYIGIWIHQSQLRFSLFSSTLSSKKIQTFALPLRYCTWWRCLQYSCE